MLSDRSVAQARLTGDRGLRLRAECVAVFAANRLGRGVTATGRAIAGVREAESVGERNLATELRVELACCARSAGSHEGALRVLRPVLEQDRIDPAIRAHALIEYAAALPVQTGDSERTAALDEADRLYAGTSELSRDTSRVLRARVSTARAYHCRRDASYTAAVDAADAGLGLLDELEDPEAESGELHARLVLERVHALFELGRSKDAVAAAQPVLAAPVRAASAAPAGWLRLVLASRVHLGEGEHEAAVRLLNDAAAAARRHRLDDLLAEALSACSYAHEERAEYNDALRCLRGAYAADRRFRACAYEARIQLLQEFPELGEVRVPHQRSPEAAPSHTSVQPPEVMADRSASQSKAEPVRWPGDSEPRTEGAHARGVDQGDHGGEEQPSPAGDRRHSRVNSDADAREVARQLMETLVSKRNSVREDAEPGRSRRSAEDAAGDEWVGLGQDAAARAAAQASPESTHAAAESSPGRRRAEPEAPDLWPDSAHDSGATSERSAVPGTHGHGRTEGRHGAVDFGVLPDGDEPAALHRDAGSHSARRFSPPDQPPLPDRTGALPESAEHSADRWVFPDVASFVPAPPVAESATAREVPQGECIEHGSGSVEDWLADFSALTSGWPDTERVQETRRHQETGRVEQTAPRHATEGLEPADDAISDAEAVPGETTTSSDVSGTLEESLPVKPALGENPALGEETDSQAETDPGNVPGSARAYGRSLAEIRESLRLFQREAFPDPSVTSFESGTSRAREAAAVQESPLDGGDPAQWPFDELPRGQGPDIQAHTSSSVYTNNPGRAFADNPFHTDGSAHVAVPHGHDEWAVRDSGTQHAGEPARQPGTSAGETLSSMPGADVGSETGSRGRRRARHGPVDEGSRSAADILAEHHGEHARGETAEAPGEHRAAPAPEQAPAVARRDDPPESAGLADLLAEALVAYEDGRRDSPSEGARTEESPGRRRATAESSGRTARTSGYPSADRTPSPSRETDSEGLAARHRKSSGNSAPGQEWPWKRTGY